jgi:hypothetical protein
MVNYRWLPSHRALPDGPAWLAVPSIRLIPAIGPADHVYPANIRAIRLEKAHWHHCTVFSGLVFIGFHADLDGRRARKTHDSGYMHVTSFPVAGSNVPQALVATGEL